VTSMVDAMSFDILNPDLYGHGDPATNGLPLRQYETMRREFPCYRQPIHDTDLMDWAWVVSRHADVIAIDRDHDRFVSGRGVTLRKFEPTLPEHGGKPSMITMDGADHVRNRRIVGRGFSPPVIRQFEARFRAICADVLDPAVAKVDVDFVTDVAGELPLRAICALLGVPDEDRADVLRWSNAFSVPTDPDYSPTMDEMMGAVLSIWAYGVSLAEKRRVDPRDDVMSKVAAALEAEQLSEDELMGMMLLLAGAGNETTRNALSHGLHALMRFPDQLELLQSEREAVLTSAVEEILRWSSPVIGFRRTTAVDVEVAGQQIPAGDPVTILYASANFDETVFPEPERFDITRTPNPHVAFGTGPHVCLGAAVARLEIRVVLEELLDRVADITQSGPIAYTRDSFLRGVKSLPVHLLRR